MTTIPKTNRPDAGFKLDRLAGFSDGVIAIAITILVLGLEVPSVHEVNHSELIDYLIESLHPAAGFVVSFVLIGTYWLEHYAIFHYLKRATRAFVLLNGLFLLCLTFLPFPTGLQSAYRDDELAMALYCIAQLNCSISLLTLWLYAVKDHRLVSPRISPDVVRSMTRRLMIAPVLSVLAIGCSFLSITLSRAIMFSIPFFYISHHVVDTGWQEAAGTTPAE